MTSGQSCKISAPSSSRLSLWSQCLSWIRFVALVLSLLYSKSISPIQALFFTLYKLTVEYLLITSGHVCFPMSMSTLYFTVLDAGQSWQTLQCLSHQRRSLLLQSILDEKWPDCEMLDEPCLFSSQGRTEEDIYIVSLSIIQWHLYHPLYSTLQLYKYVRVSKALHACTISSKYMGRSPMHRSVDQD